MIDVILALVLGFVAGRLWPVSRRPRVEPPATLPVLPSGPVTDAQADDEELADPDRLLPGY